MDFFKDTWYLYVRLYRLTRRMPVYLLLSIMQPVLWMLLFGQLFGAVTTIPGFEAESYIQFIAPGIAVMTALFSAAYSGMGLLKDIDTGVLDRLLATPVSRGAVVASRVMLSASQVFLQSGVILVIALLMGARPQSLPGLALLFVGTCLLSATFAAGSSSLALITRRQEMVIAVMNFFVLPMTFLSSMIMSHELMPEWIRSVSRFNPVDWAVTVARLGFEGQISAQLFTHLGFLTAFTLVGAALATHAFGLYQRSM